MILPERDRTWIALKATWLNVTINKIGSVEMARASIRRERFPRFQSSNAIVAISDADTKNRCLLTFASSDVSEVLSGSCPPFLKLYTGGVELVSMDEFYGWPVAESLWSKFHNSDITELVPASGMPKITRSWSHLPLGNWEMAEKSGVLSFYRKIETEQGDMTIVEVDPHQINIYLGDIFFEPALHPEFITASVLAENPDRAVLLHYLPQKIANEARFIMRWYRRILYKIVLEEARAGRT